MVMMPANVTGGFPGLSSALSNCFCILAYIYVIRPNAVDCIIPHFVERDLSKEIHWLAHITQPARGRAEVWTQTLWLWSPCLPHGLYCPQCGRMGGGKRGLPGTFCPSSCGEGRLADWRPGGGRRSRSTSAPGPQPPLRGHLLWAPGTRPSGWVLAWDTFRSGFHQKAGHQGESPGVKGKWRWGLAVAGGHLWPWVRGGRRRHFPGAVGGRWNHGIPPTGSGSRREGACAGAAGRSAHHPPTCLHPHCLIPAGQERGGPARGRPHCPEQSKGGAMPLRADQDPRGGHTPSEGKTHRSHIVATYPRLFSTWLYQ